MRALIGAHVARSVIGGSGERRDGRAPARRQAERAEQAPRRSSPRRARPALLLRWLAGLALALAACGLLASQASAAATATLSPPSVDFGGQEVNSPGYSYGVTVTNSGPGFLTVARVRLAGGDSADFAIEDDHCSGVELWPDGTCEIEVGFSPTALGYRATTLVVESNGSPDTAEVPVTGRGVPPSRRLELLLAGSGSGAVSFIPDGFSCAESCSNSFYEGSALTLEASADPGSTFAGWDGGGCDGTGPCELTLDADTTLTATFSADPAPPPLGDPDPPPLEPGPSEAEPPGSGSGPPPAGDGPPAGLPGAGSQVAPARKPARRCRRHRHRRPERGKHHSAACPRR